MSGAPTGAGTGPESDQPGPNPRYIGTERAEELANDRDKGGNGGDSGGGDQVSARVDLLERRISRLEDKLDVVIDKLAGIATRPEMRNYVMVSAGLFVAIFALVITALGWLETRASRIQGPSAATPAAAQPVIIQVPAVPSPNAGRPVERKPETATTN
jgi:hypothetical protein